MDDCTSPDDKPAEGEGRPLDDLLSAALDGHIGSVLAEQRDAAASAVVGAALERACSTPTAPGRLTLGAEIAHGGMGRVLAARDEVLQRDVAVKCFAPHGPQLESLRARFVDEARIVAQLQHPGIIPIYDLTVQEGGAPCFSMPRINGVTFASILRDPAVLASGLCECIRILRQVVSTVSYAHSRGVVHCDLKPDNIMVGAFGEVFVLDWGLARRAETQGTTGSTLPFVAGTPAYMAPELARGTCTGADPRLDVFAIGAILCEVLTGQPPYVASSARETQLSARMGWIETARERLAACEQPQALVDLAFACLEVEPERRIQDLGTAALRLDAWSASLDAELRASERRAAVGAANAMAERRLWRRTALSAGVIILLLVGGWIWRQQVLDERARVRERMARIAVAALDEARVGLGAAALVGAEFVPILQKARTAFGAAMEEFKANEFDADLREELREMTQRLVEAERAGREDEALLAVYDDTCTDGVALVSPAERWRRLAGAFSAWGWQGGEAIETLVPRVHASSQPERIITALDLFARLSCCQEEAVSPAHAVAFANQCDADAQRKRIRDALVTRDATVLQVMAHDSAVIALAPRTQVLLGESLKILQRPQEASVFYRAVIKRHPDNADVALLLAEMLAQRDPDEAVRLTWLVLAVRPRCSRAWYVQATARYCSKDAAAAREALVRLHELAPESAYADLLDARILELEGDGAAAMLKYDAALVHDPLFSRALLHRGMLHVKSGRRREALADWEECSRLAPSERDYRLAAAYLNQDCGFHEPAIAHLQSAAARSGGDAKACFAQGLALQMLGRLADAVAAYKSALQLKPDYPEAACNLGLMLQLSGELDEGLRMLRTGHALGTAGNKKWSWDSAGLIRAAERAQEREALLASALPAASSSEDAIELGRVAATRVDQPLALKLLLQGRSHWDEAPGSRIFRDRFLAARAAAAIAAGAVRGEGSEALALSLMREEFELLQAETLPSAARSLAQRLQSLLLWLHDPLLQPWQLDGAAFAASTRKTEWTKYWATHAELLAEVRKAQQALR